MSLNLWGKIAILLVEGVLLGFMIYGCTKVYQDFNFREASRLGCAWCRWARSGSRVTCTALAEQPQQQRKPALADRPCSAQQSSLAHRTILNAPQMFVPKGNWLFEAYQVEDRYFGGEKVPMAAYTREAKDGRDYFFYQDELAAIGRGLRCGRPHAEGLRHAR